MRVCWLSDRASDWHVRVDQREKGFVDVRRGTSRKYTLLRQSLMTLHDTSTPPGHQCRIKGTMPQNGTTRCSAPVGTGGGMFGYAIVWPQPLSRPNAHDSWQPCRLESFAHSSRQVQVLLVHGTMRRLFEIAFPTVICSLL